MKPVQAEMSFFDNLRDTLEGVPSMIIFNYDETNFTDDPGVSKIVFIDLEKAYDRVPREEIWICMRERNVQEKYVKLIQDMYRGCQTKVRSAAGESGSFNVDVGLHQGSALSPIYSSYSWMH